MLIYISLQSAQGMNVGYCLNYDYWGRGYTSEAFNKFIEMYWVFEGMPCP
jgi:hypothetical protein